MNMIDANLTSTYTISGQITLGCRQGCPLIEYCKHYKREHHTCQDMVSMYNANILIPPMFAEGSSM